MGQVIKSNGGGGLTFNGSVKPLHYVRKTCVVGGGAEEEAVVY
jgi:hypothetical protein